MFLMFLLFLTIVRSELQGENVCTFNDGKVHYRTVIKITREETTEPQCHAHNNFGCIRWEYYRNISTPVNETYMVNRLVKACCMGFYEVDGTCEACEQGKYGWQCQRKCECPVNSTCGSITGQCSCRPGLIGPNCDEECPVGYYGHNCTSECDCLYSGDCQKDTGKCFTGPNDVNEHITDSISPPTETSSSVLYYIIIAVPTGCALVIITLNIILIYRCRLQKRQPDRNCSQRGPREDYETIDDHFLSNNYVDMPHAKDDPDFTVSSVEFADETYNEIHPKIHHEEPVGPYTEVTCIIENNKRSHTSLSRSQGDQSDHCNYDTMSRSWERDLSNDPNKESDYNRLEKDLKSYDTFQSVKEASSMMSLPAYLDDDYSNVMMIEKSGSHISLKVESTPP